MPKKKRTVTCGKCKGKGHNARSCTAGEKGGVQKSTITTTTVEVPDPPTKKKTRIDTRERPRREAPTADIGTAATAAPYRCPKCNAVAILVIVRVKDWVASSKKGRDVYTGQTRCEQCMNKPTPAELILKWGASPDEKVTAEFANTAPAT
jgi:hypothetical protein